MFIHGREQDAEKIVRGIEENMCRDSGNELEEVCDTITIHQHPAIGFRLITNTMYATYPRRAVLGFAMFVGQAFLYNSITFGYATILSQFFDVPPGSTGYYYAVIAVFNFLGPLLLSRFFDTWGRRPMISGTYLLSG